MADKRDYYEVLGVDKNADDATLKKAYRKLAMQHSKMAAEAVPAALVDSTSTVRIWETSSEISSETCSAAEAEPDGPTMDR